MEHRRIGKSAIYVSDICMGTMTFGSQTDEAEAHRILDKCLDAGINFFDTADAYNLGLSETIMGETLMGFAPREEIVLSTKVGLKMADKPNRQGLGRKHILASIDAQLARLKTDYIDVYQVHRLDPYTPMEETMYSLDQIVRSGKVRYIGGSTMPAYKFAQMVMIADWKGYARPIAMQNLYNLIQREEEREMNRLCDEQGVGLIPYSPLARGFLAGNRSKDGGGSTERSKNDTVVKDGTYRDSDWEIVKRLKKIAKEKGATPAQVALAWLLHKPYMGAPIIGATDLDQLTSAAKSTEIALTPEDSKLLEQPYEFRVSPEN